MRRPSSQPGAKLLQRLWQVAAKLARDRYGVHVFGAAFGASDLPRKEAFLQAASVAVVRSLPAGRPSSSAGEWSRRLSCRQAQ